MMKISTKGQYALRMMVEFALHPNECTTLSQVAARHDLSDKYLEQIVAVLVRAGYVTSVRGSRGGYMLSKDPSEYTAGMILRLMEGDLAPVACLSGDAEPHCSHWDTCSTLSLWRQIDDAISQVVDHVTLADLVKDQLQKPGYTPR